jgi:hypothetical protein
MNLFYEPHPKPDPVFTLLFIDLDARRAQHFFPLVHRRWRAPFCCCCHVLERMREGNFPFCWFYGVSSGGQ